MSIIDPPFVAEPLAMPSDEELDTVQLTFEEAVGVPDRGTVFDKREYLRSVWRARHGAPQPEALEPAPGLPDNGADARRESNRRAQQRFRDKHRAPTPAAMAALLAVQDAQATVTRAEAALLLAKAELAAARVALARAQQTA